MATLLERLKAEKKQNEEARARREERILNAEVEASDCCYSILANSQASELLDAQIHILENGGLAEFRCLLDLEGNKVNAKLCNTRYGRSYRVEKEDGTIEWVNPYVKEKTLAKKGYKLGTELKPAWAKLEGFGKGLAGMMNNYVCVFPVKQNMLEKESA